MYGKNLKVISKTSFFLWLSPFALFSAKRDANRRTRKSNRISFLRLLSLRSMPPGPPLSHNSQLSPSSHFVGTAPVSPSDIGIWDRKTWFIICVYIGIYSEGLFSMRSKESGKATKVYYRKPWIIFSFCRSVLAIFWLAIHYKSTRCRWRPRQGSTKRTEFDVDYTVCLIISREALAVMFMGAQVTSWPPAVKEFTPRDPFAAPPPKSRSERPYLILTVFLER